MLKKIFPVLALPIFSALLGAGIILPLLPLYAQSLGATGVGLGTLTAAFFISRAISMPIIGRLSDRRGRKMFIWVGLLIYSVVSLGYIWADNVLQLSLVRLIHGAAGGMIIPIAQAYIGDIAPEGEEGKWMGYFNAAFFAGMGFGPLMGGLLSDSFGMDSAFYAMGGLNLLAFLVAIFFLPESKERKSMSQDLSFKKMTTSGMVKGLFSFRIGYSIGLGAFITFLPIFTVMYLALSATRVGILIAVLILLMSVLMPFLGNVADRFNRKTLVILGSIISLGSIALVPPLAYNFWAILGLCALMGVGGAIAMPASSALSIDEGRKFGMGSTMAIFVVAMDIGTIIGPILGGVIADFVNINSVFYYSAAMGIIGIVLFAWFTRGYQRPSFNALQS